MAEWSGGLKEGKGTVSTESGALKEWPYGYSSRFEGRTGTNPEELLGAAHAACFTMALSLMLGEHKLVADHLHTTARVTLESAGGGFRIAAVHLSLTARIPGADQETFAAVASKAKAGCPVSKVLNAAVTLETHLVD